MKIKKSAVIAVSSIAAIILTASVFFHLKKNNTEGINDMGNISYNGQEMLLINSGIKELPAGYNLSSQTVNLDNNSLLISGEYEVYSSESTDGIIYIYVDDEIIGKAKCGYWKFGTSDVYNQD